MLRFEYSQRLLNKTDFLRLQGTAGEYAARLESVVESGAYDADESSVNLPSDETLLENVYRVVDEKVSDELLYHIVVGIGGSNLGTKAVYDALHGYGDVLEPGHMPKLIFAETTDPEWLQKAVALVKDAVSPDEILISVISKSGGTTETMANFEIIAGALKRKFNEYHERIVAITDEGSQLWQAAEEQQITTLAIPKKVGGRYSVFSAVGLFPLVTAGIDVEELRAGAMDMRDHSLSETGENTPARSAEVLAYYYADGRVINDNFMFHSELESLGKWYRQLMGESIGKKESLDGEILHAGITPTVSLGSTDLHSVGQLYLGGPKDKFTTFVYADETVNISVPDDRIFPDVNPMVTGRSAKEIMEAIFTGVKIAYSKADLPYAEVVLERLDERSLGAYLQFKMMEMMYLGQLLNVNSFDQPSVESYKIETKRILDGEGL